MKIGVITTSFPRFAGDPAGSFVGDHVAALRRLGHEVEIIAAGGPPRELDRDTEAEDRSVTRIASDLFYRGGAPDALERSLRSLPTALGFAARLAVEVIRRADAWDLIVAHWLAPSAFAALPSRARLLAIAHGGDVHLLRRMRLLAPALYALRARRARLAFVSHDLLELARAAAPRLRTWLDTAAIVQPMGIDAARFAALGRAPVHPPTILVAARLVPIKGVDVALDALAHLRAPARLVIAGDGPEREVLAARATSVERDLETVFLGSVDTHARDRLLREASVVVVPSRVLSNGRTEGMPMIALEALATGVPLVASDVGGLRALATHALLVPPDQPLALAAAIDRVLLEPRGSAPFRVLDWPIVTERLLAHAHR
ncbi:MAG: glycosyl transferase group 1 [Myxococcales bacterium]|nr:glycosyl transferase group 1 [Myxococcales bacterium]